MRVHGTQTYIDQPTYQERLIFLNQQVDDEFANQLIDIMMYMNGYNWAKVFFMCLLPTYQERLIFLNQQVDDEIGSQLIDIMMYMNGEN